MFSKGEKCRCTVVEIGATLYDKNLKQHLYFHRMSEGNLIDDHLATFKEIVANLKMLEVKYDKNDFALMLLCSLLPSYSTFRDTILYNRDTLTMNKVYDALLSKEKIKHLVVGSES